MKFSNFLSLIMSLAFISNATAETNKSVLVSLMEIDPNEIGSKARPERRRIIEAALQLATKTRSKELAKKGLTVKFVSHDLFQAHDSAINSVRKAISSSAVAGIGLPTSYYAEIGGNALAGTNMVVVSPFATASNLNRFNDNLILLMPSNRHSAKALYHFLVGERKTERLAAIVPWDNSFSRDFFKEFESSSEKPLNLIKIIDDQENLENVVNQIRTSNPDAILLPTFPAFTGILIRTLHESGFKGTFVGPSSWGEGSGKPLHAIVDNLPINAFSIRETSEYFLSPEQSKFIKSFKIETGLTYSAEAGLYFDAANLLIDRIIEIGRTVNRQKMSESLRKNPYRCGIFSNICSKKNVSSKKRLDSFKIIQIRNGLFSPYTEISLEN